MSRTPRSTDAPPAHFVRAWRQHAGMTLEALADLIGMSHQNLGRIERGKVPLSDDHIPNLARALRVSPPDLYRSPDEPSRSDTAALVRIIGRVGANPDDEVVMTSADEAFDFAFPPPGGTSDSVALEVHGHSMRGFADDGALIYFEIQRTPPTPDMLGHVAIVETEDGRVLLKRLLRGSGPGLYDLESANGPTIRDVRLRWAAEPTAIVPPKHARKIIRRAGEAAA